MYVSPEVAAEYLELMGQPELSDPEALLARASRIIDMLYGSRFIGTVVDPEQTTFWPRQEDGVAIPISPALGEATIELALLLDSGVDVFAQPEPMVVSQSLSAGPISTSKTFGSQGYQKDPLYKISLLLGPILAKPARSIRLVRG